MKPHRSGASEEYELVLLIISENPDLVIERISGMRSVAGYSLKRGDALKIHDIYFDTQDRFLGRHRLNLRLREAANAWRITLKRNPGLVTWNRNRRREIELEWSSSNWKFVAGEISSQGLDIGKDESHSVEREGGPVGVLLDCGLSIIQDRETQRMPSHIVSGDGELLAELAIDTVSYHFSIGEVSLSELEVESKSRSGDVVLRRIVEDLVRTFPTDLRRWNSGKLRTGATIDRLLREDRLKGMVGEGGRLKPEAYDLIAKG